MRWRDLAALALLGLAFECAVGAQSTNVTTLDPLVITGTRYQAASAQVPAAISVIPQQALPYGQPALGLDAALNGVPGVFAQNSYNFAQDQRLSIRGFGTRAAFGIREITFTIDGLPETGPDGQTELDALDLESVERITVLRGPAAALYGNAAGGVVAVETEDGPDRPVIEAQATAGAFGLRQYRANTGGEINDLNYILNAANFSLDGYRDHSRARSTLVTGKARQALDPQADVTTVFTLVDAPLAEDAGGLTRAQVDEDRRQARDLNTTLDAGEDVRQGKLGCIYRQVLLPEQFITLNTFVLTRDFENRLPILPSAGGGIVAFDRTGAGAGAHYSGASRLAGLPNRLLAGIDTQYQADDRQRFNNEAGHPGSLRLSQDETVTSAGAYLRDELELREALQAGAGLRYDHFRFDVDDHYPIDGNDSGTRNMDQISPMTSLLYSNSPLLQLYANVATAYQVPTTTEFANPDEGGGLNPDLDPQQAVSVEVGARGTAGERLTYQAACFRIELEDELVPFEGTSGRTFYRNAGRSSRQGAELALEAPLAGGCGWSLAYTYIEAAYDDYATPAGTFDGKDEPGIPPHQGFAELWCRRPSGPQGALNALYVDEYPVDDANTARNDAYWVLNLRLGYDAQLGALRLSPFAGLNNLTDERYNGLVRLNAAGGRYFEPAPERNAYAGLRVACAF